MNILADEASGKNLALGFADGDVYNCTRPPVRLGSGFRIRFLTFCGRCSLPKWRLSRYASDFSWLREARGWPSEAVAWFSDFLSNRPGVAPRESYVQDLMAGKRPGEGSTLMDLAIATDVFRRSDPVADLQRNLERGPQLERERSRAER